MAQKDIDDIIKLTEDNIALYEKMDVIHKQLNDELHKIVEQLYVGKALRLQDESVLYVTGINYVYYCLDDDNPDNRYMYVNGVHCEYDNDYLTGMYLNDTYSETINIGKYGNLTSNGVYVIKNADTLDEVMSKYKAVCDANGKYISLHSSVLFLNNDRIVRGVVIEYVRSTGKYKVVVDNDTFDKIGPDLTVI